MGEYSAHHSWPEDMHLANTHTHTIAARLERYKRTEIIFRTQTEQTMTTASHFMMLR